jgi:hypothetical protein
MKMPKWLQFRRLEKESDALRLENYNLRAALSRYEDVHTPVPWIKVQDALPEEHELVWMYCAETRKVLLGRYYGPGSFDGFWAGPCWYADVTHWRVARIPLTPDGPVDIWDVRA